MLLYHAINIWNTSKKIEESAYETFSCMKYTYTIKLQIRKVKKKIDFSGIVQIRPDLFIIS